MATEGSFAVVPFTRKTEEQDGSIALVRHPKMSAVETEAFKKASEDMALNVALNLPNQADITSRELVGKEIDELTSSADYYPITKRQLEKIFKMQQLHWLCFVNNVLSVIRTFINPWYRPTVSIMAPVACYMLCSLIIGSHLSNADKWLFGSILVPATILGVCIAIFVPTLRFRLANIELNLESTKKTRIKIPYGAKLKLLEAKEKGIFEDFVVAHPKLDIKDFDVTVRFPADPAILGVARDDRMFMICWWDIQNDVDRVTKNIKEFRKFKIKG